MFSVSYLIMEADAQLAKTNRDLLPHVVPLVLVKSKSATFEDIIHTASGALVYTGEKYLLVTCYHVWNKFREHMAEHPDALVAAVLGAGPATVVSSFPLSDEAQALDISILDVTGSEFAKEVANRFATVPEWPPARAVAGDSIVVIGFPGSDKKAVLDQAGVEAVQFSTTSLMFVVTSVSDRHIVLADVENARREIKLSEDDMGPDFSFGGMSGCPAFVSRSGRFDFAGIMYEGPDRDYRSLFFLSHATFITKTGKIDWSQAPFV